MDTYNGKLVAAQKALEGVRSWQHVVIGSGASEPQLLVSALAARAASLYDLEVIHLMTLGPAAYASAEFEGRLRHNALFIGANVRGAVAQGLADYTPCFLYEVPSLIRSGRLPVDAALIQVSPPKDGFCSLGVSVDILKAAVERASYVVAQVNGRMPWTEGDSLVPVSKIDAFVAGDAPILQPSEPSAAAAWIARYVSQLISDGSTLQLGIGAVPEAVLGALGDKRDLGIHSEMITDAVLPLIESGVVNGRAKSLHPGKIVVSFCLGSEKLYRAVDRNPLFEFRPCDYVNDPAVIALNDKMVAVNSALQVDLTGQVAADSIGHRFYSGVGGQVDFMRGAARSRGGKAIIAMPSTAKGGRVSRIVAALTEGTGVVTTRADVDFVVTEYGIASLKGKTIRERAIALISISDPSYREALTAAAKRLGYVDGAHVLPPSASPYLVDLETRSTFKGREVFFRPLKPSDERRLKDLFYSQSAETTALRYGIPLKRLSEDQFQRMVAVDFRTSMAIAAFVNDRGREIMIAVGRYFAEPGEIFAEAAFTVEDRYQHTGIGTFLLHYLSWIAKERGLTGFRAEMTLYNAAMRGVVQRCFRKAEEKDLGPDGVAVLLRFEDWKGFPEVLCLPKKSCAVK